MANFFKAKPSKKQLPSLISVKIDRLDPHGCGVGYYQKKPVFVDGALVDELVQVKIIEQKSKFLRGKIIAIQNQSSTRVEPKCKHFYRCGGCDLQHLAYDKQINFKQEKISQLFARNGLDEAMNWQAALCSEPWHYRRKARIGVQYSKHGDAIIGFRAKGSNQLININHCPVLVEEFAEIFTKLKELFQQLSGHKSVGHIEIISANQHVLVVRQLEKLSDGDRKLWLAFEEKNNWLVVMDDGEQLTPLTAPPKLHYALAQQVQLTFRTHDFIQVNHLVNQAMISQALTWLALTSEDVVLDLFCGLGNFSLPIAKQVAKVIGVEGVQAMVEHASDNAKHNQLTNCQFYQADLNSDWQGLPWQNESFTKVILDPARAGAYQALQQLVKWQVPTILYVSCDPATLAKDSKLLVDQGYKIDKIALMDMFSQTKHVETMVLFSLSR